MKRNVSPNFYYCLLEFLLSAKQHMIAIGGEFGLTSIQAVSLLLLDEDHPRPMKSLGMLFNCDPSNVTGIVDGLEQKGLVLRENHPEDRRIKIVRITAAGRRLQQQIIEQLEANNGYLFDPLTDTEATQFVHIVSKLAQAKSQPES